MAIKAFSGGISQQPLPDFNLTNIQDGDMLQYSSPTKAFVNIRGLVLPTTLSALTNDLNYITQLQLDTAIASASLSGGGASVDLSAYATTATVTGNNLTINARIDALDLEKADQTYVDGLFNNLNIPDISNLVTQTSLNTVVSALNTASTDLTGYATEAWVTSAISAIQLPDTTSFLTETQIDARIAAISITSLSQLTDDIGVATQAWVAQQIANVEGGSGVDLSGFVTETELTTAIAGVTHPTTISTFTNDSGYLSSHQSLSNYVTTTALSSAISGVSTFSGSWNDLTDKPTIPTLTGYATEAWVTQQLANIDSGVAVDLSGYVTTATLATYATTESLTTALAAYQPVVDLSAYATNASLTLQIAEIDTFSGNYTDLTNKPVIPVLPSNVMAFTNDAGYVTQLDIDSSLPDLSGYALSADVPGVVDLANYALRSELPSLTGLATTAYVDSRIALTHQGLVLNNNLLTISEGNTVDLSGLAGSGSTDLAGYATETYVTNALSSASIASVSALDDLNDVAIDGTETVTHALMFNSLSGMWENVDLTENWASKDYVTAQLTSFSTDGTIDLEGYASETWVDQRILERGPHFSGDYNELVNSPNLFSGDYNDLYNTPVNQAANLSLTLSGNTLALSNGNDIDLSGLLDYSNFTNTPTLFSGNYNELINLPNLFSGNYLDLTNKPYIPSIAGLASEDFVNNRWAEPEITGDRQFTHDVEVQGKSSIVAIESAEACARHDNYVMCVETTNETTTEALLVGGGRVTIEDNSTLMYEAHVIGSTGTHKYGIRLKGIADRTSGTLSLIGSPSRETLTENEYSWTADVEVDATNNSLKFTVVGNELNAVHWTIFVSVNTVKR